MPSSFGMSHYRTLTKNYCKERVIWTSKVKHTFFFFHEVSLWSILFLISNFAVFRMLYSFFYVIFRRLNFMCRRFGTFYLFHLHVHATYEDGTECSDTSARNIQTPRNHPKERIQYIIIVIAFTFITVVDVWTSGT